MKEISLKGNVKGRRGLDLGGGTGENRDKRIYKTYLGKVILKGERFM